MSSCTSLAVAFFLSLDATAGIQARRNLVAIRSIALVVTALLVTPPANAQSFMVPAEAARVLADGQPWSVTTSEGRRARMTLNSDGSGTFEGPITISISWQIKAEDLCIDLKMAGNKCMRFRSTSGSYEGYSGTALDLTFTRAQR